MATTALVMLQPVWDCRWSRNGYHLTGVADAQQPEGEWVCVREGARRNVSDEECRTCPHWELTPGSHTHAHVVHVGASGEVAVERVLALSTKAVLVLTAALFVAIGFVTLTEPMAVPFTVTMWLCAAAFAGLAVFWQPSGTT
jgi:hypothetical protein